MAILPPIPTPLDPSSGPATDQQQNLNIAAGVAGLLASLSASFVSASTSIQTFLAYTLPGYVAGQAGGLAPGALLRFKAWGTNGAGATACTVTLSFGGTTVALVVTGTSTTWTVEGHVLNRSTSVQAMELHGVQATTALLGTQATAAINTAAPVAVLLQSTNATASNMTVLGATIEVVQ